MTVPAGPRVRAETALINEELEPPLPHPTFDIVRTIAMEAGHTLQSAEICAVFAQRAERMDEDVMTSCWLQGQLYDYGRQLLGLPSRFAGLS